MCTVFKPESGKAFIAQSHAQVYDVTCGGTVYHDIGQCYCHQYFKANDTTLQLVSVHEVATGQIVLVAVPPSLAQSLSVSLSLLHHEFDTCEFQQMSPKLTAELRGLQETD